MPRIFHVTLRREMECTIVAESEAELDAALTKADLDDWDPPDWEWDITDPTKLLRTTKDLDRLPDEPDAPDMGVIKREVLAFSDVEAEVPDILEQISNETKALKQRITLEEINGNLFKKQG